MLVLYKLGMQLEYIMSTEMLIKYSGLLIIKTQYQINILELMHFINLCEYIIKLVNDLVVVILVMCFDKMYNK